MGSPFLLKQIYSILDTYIDNFLVTNELFNVKLPFIHKL